jgi:hypothetical protein
MYDHETTQKLVKLRALSDAIVEARKIRDEQPGYDSALNVQQLERQRDELRALVPSLKAVA